MKNKIIALILVVASCAVIACNGDHSDRVVRDTAESNYDPPKSLDTTKTTTTTGDAGSLDNSGSGGTRIDTPAKKTASPK